MTSSFHASSSAHWYGNIDTCPGCFSVSNLGGSGGTLFTPIVNVPEVAILGISRAKMEPVYEAEVPNLPPKVAA